MSEQSSPAFTSLRNTCFTTRKTTRDRARKRGWKFIDLHPFRTQPFSQGLFCALHRRIYLPTVEMTPDGTCFTHDARIDGIGKKRARDYMGELKSAASVNREFYHGPGTFPGKLPHQFDSDPRVSLLARVLPGVGLYASKQEKCLLARKSLRDCFRLKFFFDWVAAPVEIVQDGKRKSCHVTISFKYCEM